MTIKLGMTLLLFILVNSVHAQPRCVHEGQSIVIHPDAPKVCCEGLIRIPPPEGMVGSGGKCVREIKKECVEEGKLIVIHPEAPQKCCEGLKRIPPPKGILGIGGKCVAVKRSCVEEGKSIPLTPFFKLKCCPGLELQRPEPGILGTRGTCVEMGHPTPINVYDSKDSKKLLDAQDVEPTKSSSAKKKVKEE